MGSNSNIEWTDATWNPVVGCTKVSPGCAHCYAETMACRLRGMALADMAAGRNPGRKRHYIDAVDDKGRWTGKLIPVPEALSDPLKWKKPRRVFVNSMSDLFHESVPDKFIDQVVAVIGLCGQHTFQVLTKRADRMATYMNRPHLGDDIYAATEELAGKMGNADYLFDEFPWKHLWLGVSVENQAQCDARVEHLLKTPAAVRFVSAEPLLERVDFGLRNWAHIKRDDCRLDWMIVGGESGPGARPMRSDWVREIRDDCNQAGVAFFFKQWGEWAPALDHHVDDIGITRWLMPDATIAPKPFTDGAVLMGRVGKHAAGRLLDGREWNEMPEVKHV